MLLKNKKIIIPLSIIVAGIIIASAFVFINEGKNKRPALKELSAELAAEKTINYINENILAKELVASLVDVSDIGSVYKIRLKIEETEFNSYISKDGEFLFPEGYNMNEAFIQNSGTGTPAQ